MESTRATVQVPAPPSTGVLAFPPFASDSAKRRETGVIASHIGSDTETFSSYRHCLPAPRTGLS
jgi:hypothetical protein